MARNHEELEIIARNAKRLNREPMDILKYQPYTSQDIHEALFGNETPQPRTLGELKEGIRAHIRKRHALERLERLRQ